MTTQKVEKTVFGTKEWAAHNENCMSGCSHDCRYCYAKSMAVRFKRRTSDNWQHEIFDQSKLAKRFKQKEGRFMFPTTHDITPEHLDACMEFLGNILKAGNEVLIVSKPHIDCIRSLCGKFDEYRQQILFRFTIGSADNDTLRFWDQHAPGFQERLESLAYAHRAGYATSVSCEPLLDNNADDLIRQVRPFVTDAIWLGKANGLIGKIKINGYGDRKTISRAVHLIESLSDEYLTDLYNRHKDDPQVKWKESIKKVVGIEVPIKAGLDI
jgi:DNA repair photolyase